VINLWLNPLGDFLKTHPKRIPFPKGCLWHGTSLPAGGMASVGVEGLMIVRLVKHAFKYLNEMCVLNKVEPGEKLLRHRSVTSESLDRDCFVLHQFFEMRRCQTRDLFELIG
jgi:hypothetical protein